MRGRHLHLAAILLVAIAMAAAWAHLLALPNKMTLTREDYLTVQGIYRGWALLGIPVIASLAASATLTLRQYNAGAPFQPALVATLCVALALGVFFVFTYPANVATENWSRLPEDWEALRRQWEFSHAVAAVLYFAALAALSVSALD